MPLYEHTDAASESDDGNQRSQLSPSRAASTYLQVIWFTLGLGPEFSYKPGRSRAARERELPASPKFKLRLLDFEMPFGTVKLNDGNEVRNDSECLALFHADQCCEQIPAIAFGSGSSMKDKVPPALLAVFSFDSIDVPWDLNRM